MIYLIILFAFLIIVFQNLKSATHNRVMQMSLWLIISYTFLVLTCLFSGIEYKAGSILRISPYLLTCLLLVMLGEQLGRYVKLKPGKSLSISITFLALLSISGSIILIVDTLRLNNIVLGNRIAEYNISFIGVLGYIFSSFGLIVWLFGIYGYLINRQKIGFVSYAGIIAYISGGIISAGRQALILSILTTFILVLWCLKKRKQNNQGVLPVKVKRRKPIGLIILITIFLSYFLFISSVRSGIFNLSDKIKMMEGFFNAKVSEETLRVTNGMGPLSDIYIEALFYYSHELNRLDIMFQHYDYYPVLGLSQMGYIERRLRWLFGNQGDISWAHVVKAVENNGNFSSHTWGTFITNYIVDFGRFGALIACFITGLIYGILYRSLINHESPEKVLRHVILLAGVVFSIQFSPLAELIWIMPIVLSSFIKIKPKSKELTMLYCK